MLQLDQFAPALRARYASTRERIVTLWHNGSRRSPTIKNFAHVVWNDWGARMSGIFSVPFGFAAVVSDKGALVWAAMATAALLVCAYRVWASEREKVIELEAAALPALTFEFDPQLATYSYFYQQTDHQDVLIIVRNLSTTKTIDDVKVFLEWVSLGDRTRTQPKEESLQLQFKPTDTTSIAPTGNAHFRLCSILQDVGPPPAMDVPPLGIVFAPKDGRLHEKAGLRLGSYEAHVRLEGRHVPPVWAVYRVIASQVSGSLAYRPKLAPDNNWCVDSSVSSIQQ